VVKRKTQRERMIRKLKELRLEMKKRMHAPIPDQSRWLGSVLRGHCAYFGRPVSPGSTCSWYGWWLWVLRRRGQRPHLPWQRFNAILKRHPPPPPRLVPT
jgi:RNA-directed DNA polymerase